MTDRLPPLDCVVAFVEAARAGSFKEAAGRLGLTTSGISRRVAQLEADLGQPLFRRFNRRIELTAAARHYLTAAAPAIDELRQASARLRRRGPGARRVRLRTMQSFAATWLVPRLPRFYAAHPGIEVEIDTASQGEDGPGEGEMAVRFGTGPWRGYAVDRLAALHSFPVAAPALLKARPIRKPADLATHTLLHARHVPELWPDWLVAAGVPDLVPAGQRRYDNTQLLYQAAINGLGVAIATDVLVTLDLAARRLVKPLPLAHPIAKSFHLVYRRRDLERPHLRVFRQWMLDEMAGSSVAP
jgi:LysR family glycine cleavage system transcriptional activator